MDGACSTNGKDEMYTQFWSEKLKGTDLRVSGRIILLRILGK
jgi:hypothetical protein